MWPLLPGPPAWLPPSFPPSALGPRPPAGPPSPRCQCLVPRKLHGVRTEHARRRRAGPGSGSCPNPPAPATCGVAGPRRAMLSARGLGRATWVLAEPAGRCTITLPAESRKLDQPLRGGVPSSTPWACGLRTPPPRPRGGARADRPGKEDRLPVRV